MQRLARKATNFDRFSKQAATAGRHLPQPIDERRALATDRKRDARQALNVSRRNSRLNRDAPMTSKARASSSPDHHQGGQRPGSSDDP